MKQDGLLSLLRSYKPAAGTENDMYLETRTFVTENADCFERSLKVGHVTASGWVVSPDKSQVLLMHHRKLDRWFQPGGHCDGDPDVVRVAGKEVLEETGITRLRLVKEEIFDVDVHLIPANSKDEAHFHYDIRFLFEADPTEKLLINLESKDLKWVPVQEIHLLNDSESIMRMAAKTIA